MEKRSKTAVPSKSRRETTTKPEGSSMKRINNSPTSKAEEGPTINSSSPAAGADTSINLSTDASSSTLNHEQRVKCELITLLHGAPRLRWSSTCVIEIWVISDFECMCGRGASSNADRNHWMGILRDALDLQSGFAGHPIGEIFGDDDTSETRDAIVSQFQALAQALGYTHCEVREFPDAGEEDYLTVFGGIMTTEVEMYLH